jgi:uncharacterized protein YlaI
MKICSKCKLEKPLDQFNKRKKSPDGKMYMCKDCNRLAINTWHKNNKDKVRANLERFHNKHPHYMNNAVKKWSDANRKQWINSYEVRKLTNKIRNLIYDGVKRGGWKKTTKTETILGCNFEYFKHHIEEQFQPGMSWDNHGEWHFDHIIPVSSAKCEEEVIRLNHYINFQPLWAVDNLKKGARM